MLERASFRCSLGCTCQVSMVHMIGQYTDWSCGPSSWGIYPSWVRLSECGCSSGIGYVMAQCPIRITDLRINEPDRVSTLVGNGYHIVVANPYWQNRFDCWIQDWNSIWIVLNQNLFQSFDTEFEFKCIWSSINWIQFNSIRILVNVIRIEIEFNIVEKLIRSNQMITINFKHLLSNLNSITI